MRRIGEARRLGPQPRSFWPLVNSLTCYLRLKVESRPKGRKRARNGPMRWVWLSSVFSSLTVYYFPQKWRATEISKAFRDGRTPPPPPSPIVASNVALPSSSNPTDPNASQTLTASSLTSLPPPEPSSSTPPPGHVHSRTLSSQSPPPVSTSFVITSPNGTGTGSSNGTGTSSRRRASDVSASTPVRSVGSSSPSWSSRVTGDASGRQSSSVETSPAKEKRIRRGLSNLSNRATPGVNEEDSETDPGTEEDESGSGGRRERVFDPAENGHEASGAGVWDARQVCAL